MPFAVFIAMSEVVLDSLGRVLDFASFSGDAERLCDEVYGDEIAGEISALYLLDIMAERCGQGTRFLCV